MGEDLDCVLRIPPTSPSRRDYGIRTPARSSSPVSFDIRSPWLPRDQLPRSPGTVSREVEAFRQYESNPPPLVLERSAYYSGPLPAVVGLPDRSLPSFSGPLPGFSSAAIENIEFATWARIYHRQHAHDSNSLPGSPEVGSSRRSSEGANDESTEQGRHELAAPAAQFSARAGMHGRVGSVSGELGRSDEVAKPISLVSRGYKSGELLVLEGAVNVDGVGDPAQEQRDSGLKDANWDEPMVTIPFKWEEKKGSRSRASSTATPKLNGAEIGAGVGDFSFGSSHTKTSVESGSEASVSDARVSKPVKASVAAPDSAPKKAGVRSAVPFKWEDAPGKPKLEDSAIPESIPALQLPPRLASASVKRSSWTTSTPSTRTRSNSSLARPRHTRSSPESTSSKHSRQSQQLPKSKSSRQQQPSLQLSSPQLSSLQPSSTPQLGGAQAQSRHTLHPNFLSGPLDSAAKPREATTASKSGPISQFGLPQYQSVDFFSVRSSPTSTLHGPGGGSSSDGGHSHAPSSCSSDHKSASVTYSHSQSAGTSAESLEQWSYQGHESFESETAGTTTTSTTPRRRSPISKPPPPSSSSKSKPPMNPSSHLHPHPEDLHPTRLPYKMPEIASPEIVVVRPAAASPSPSRALRQSSKCFELPRFLSKGGSSGGVVEENVSRDAPLSCVEDGYRSPAYKATLELLSPSPSTTSRARSSKLGSASSRHFVEELCNSLKHSLPMFSKRNGGKKKTVITNDNSFTKRHPALTL